MDQCFYFCFAGYALGFRGYGLLFATISILVPVIFAMAFVYKRFMPPKLKPYQPDYLNLDFLHQPPQDEGSRDDTGGKPAHRAS